MHEEVLYLESFNVVKVGGKCVIHGDFVSVFLIEHSVVSRTVLLSLIFVLSTSTAYSEPNAQFP